MGTLTKEVEVGSSSDCRACASADDILLNKAATIERCVARAREEYAKDPGSFGVDLSRLDAALLNIQRAGKAARDMGQHLVRRERLGMPQGASDVFALLATGGWIDGPLAERLQGMVRFCNIAVRDDQKLQLPMTIAVITSHLDDFLLFSAAMLTRDVA